MAKRKISSLINMLWRTFVTLSVAVALGMGCSFFYQTRATDLSVFDLSFENTADDTSMFTYLSDLDPYASRVGWGVLRRDQDSAGGKLSLRYDGGIANFDKGLFAHASSDIYYNLEDLGIAGEYDYLTAYVGLNRTAASSSNGVIFWVYGSENGGDQPDDWKVLYNEERKVSLPGAEADFIKLDIREYKYLRLQAYDNGSNGNDHAVWADLKLTKEGYDPFLVPSVDIYDEDLKKVAGLDLATNQGYELTLLRRNLVKKVGQYNLTQFLRADEGNREVLEWLFNNLEVLREYTTGGAPSGGYGNALNVLARLYGAHKDDLANDTVTENGVRLGDLYTRMMLTLSLTHSAGVGSWLGGGQYSDALKRYEVFKSMYERGLLESRTFELLEVEEMRWVMNDITTDEEIEWINRMSRDHAGTVNPYSFITYRFGYNYNLPEYYSEENREKWDAKYHLSEYGVPYGVQGKNKIWMVFEQGSVCGGLSKTGSNLNSSYGYPAAVIGQPGHAAYLFYRQDADGNGVWGLGNNISGWTRSEKSERLLLGWGSNSWDSYYQVSYVPYAQAALNDMDNYQLATETLLLKDLYADNYDELEKVYRKALSYQNIHMDAWYGLIQLYKADGRKTEADFVALAKEIAGALTYYPLPMWDLLNLLKPNITSSVGQTEFLYAQREALEIAKMATNAEVLQSDVSRTMANYLLNNNDLSVANFSFDGENAGKIMLAGRYLDESTETVFEYSIDGKETWSQPITEKSWQLTPEEIAKVNSTDDIVIHIVGTADHDSDYVIDIIEQSMPTLYANDLENRVIGADNKMEWRFSENDEWTSYAKEMPNLAGKKVVQVRVGANGTKLASDFRTYAFTEDNNDPRKRYISIDQLSIAGVSTEATSHQGQAANVIDGNYNTRWHSAWDGTDRDKWITIELSREIYLSAIDYMPAGGGNGKIIDMKVYGSRDGVNFVEIGTASGLTANDVTKTIEIPTLSEPVKFVKIVGERTSAASQSLSFIAARMFNFYEDSTIVPAPAVRVEYSTTLPTNQNVIATLVGVDEEVTVTNNDGSASYEFTDNGEFTFEYQGVNGQTGRYTAHVDWIDRVAPVAKVVYDKPNPVTNEQVVATLMKINPEDEDFEITNNEGRESYTFSENGEFVFVIRDVAGNENRIIARVDWITLEDQEPSDNPEGPGASDVPGNPSGPSAGDNNSVILPGEPDFVVRPSGPAQDNNASVGDLDRPTIKVPLPSGDGYIQLVPSENQGNQNGKNPLPGKDTDRYDVNFIGEDGAEISAKPDQVTIDVPKEKEIKAVYRVKENGELVPVEFEKVGKDKITLKQPESGEYIFDYGEEDKKTGAGSNRDEQQEKEPEEKSIVETKMNEVWEWFKVNQWWIWIVVASVVVILLVGGGMVSNRRR